MFMIYVFGKLFYPKHLCIQMISFISSCFPWESNPAVANTMFYC